MKVYAPDSSECATVEEYKTTVFTFGRIVDSLQCQKLFRRLKSSTLIQHRHLTYITVKQSV